MVEYKGSGGESLHCKRCRLVFNTQHMKQLSGEGKNMSDLTTFKPTVKDVKDIIESYTVDGEPAACTDDQAQNILNSWNDSLEDAFYEHVRGVFMDAGEDNE